MFDGDSYLECARCGFRECLCPLSADEDEGECAICGGDVNWCACDEKAWSGEDD